MGLLDNILSGLPENALLRQKNSELETKNASLDQEVAILKDQLREANGKVAKLEKRIKDLTHVDLDENDILVLKTLSTLRVGGQSDRVTGLADLHLQVAKFHIQRLADTGYVRRVQNIYSLEQKGREYLIRNNLI